MKKVVILFLLAFFISISLEANVIPKKKNHDITKDKGLIGNTVNTSKNTIVSKRMDIIRKMIERHKTGNITSSRTPSVFNPAINNSLNKPTEGSSFLPYTAYGFEDSYSSPNMYHRGFSLDQVNPMVNAYPPYCEARGDYLMYGGTTANWGLGLVTCWDDIANQYRLAAVYRGAYFLDMITDPYWNRSSDGEYWPVDIAFDHTTNTLYYLYFLS